MSCNNFASPVDSPSSLVAKTESKTLRIRTVSHLAAQLRVPEPDLRTLGRDADGLYIEFNRVVRGKRRLLVMAVPRLAFVQRRILTNLLLRLPPFVASYGAAKGKSIKDNALAHVDSRFVAKLDIRDFYPSIHRKRVYRFFRDDQECSPDVARILTRLTTRKHVLPLGVATSPMLADQVLRLVDNRIWGMARKLGLHYTRYVDDITLSGGFTPGRLVALAKHVLSDAGFRVKGAKCEVYGPHSRDKERIVTGVRLVGGRTSAPIEYVRVLREELIAAAAQSQRQEISGDFQPREHYRGRIVYVKWLDPQLGVELMRLYRKVKWHHLEWAMQRTGFPSRRALDA